MVNRLLEVETYRTLALLGLPEAEAAGPVIRRIETELPLLVERMREGEGLDASRELLAHLAETSHGKFSPLGEWKDWNKNLHVEEQHFSRIHLLDLWNHPLLLGFLLTMLAADWVARKLLNLP